MLIALENNYLSSISAALIIIGREGIILLLAVTLDYLLGDPWGWLHPVQVMGWLIQKYSDLALKSGKASWRKAAGICLGIGLIVGSGFSGWLIIKASSWIDPLLGNCLAVIMLASCFAGKSLRVAVEDVLWPLNTGDFAAARDRLKLYVGRDTDSLSESEVLRALLETIAENTVDGVTAPLFYAILGTFLPGVGAVPLALAYKAASTLDSMIGYRHEPYTDLGWFCAQLEDRLTWLPCRLTVLTLSLFSGRPKEVLSICRRDGIKDPSPNSGWSEAVYAAILQVQLGGENSYQGTVRVKPLLGEAIEPITVVKIRQALNLTRYCFLAWLAIAIFSYLFLRL